MEKETIAQWQARIGTQLGHDAKPTVVPAALASDGNPSREMRAAAARMLPPTAGVAVSQTSPRGGSSVDVVGIAGRPLPIPEPK